MIEIHCDRDGFIKNVLNLDYVQTDDDLLQRLSYATSMETHSLLYGYSVKYNEKHLGEIRIYEVSGTDHDGFLIYCDDRDDVIVGSKIDIEIPDCEAYPCDENGKPLKMMYDEDDLEDFRKNGRHQWGAIV